MHLLWDNASDNEEYFVIERKLASAGEDAWMFAGTSAADATIFSDTMPDLQLAYEYRVKAFGAGGQSTSPPIYVEAPRYVLTAGNETLTLQRPPGMDMRSASVTLSLSDRGKPVTNMQLDHDWVSAPNVPYPQTVFYPNVRTANRITDADGQVIYTFDYNAQTTPGTYTIRFICADLPLCPGVTLTIIIQ